MLLEFERQTRAGGGLRIDQAGAVNEEAEEYRAQILNSGSIVLPNGKTRVIPIVVGTPMAALLEGDYYNKFTHIYGNSLINETAFDALRNARAFQRIEATGNYLEAKLVAYELIGTAGFGIVPAGFAWRNATRAQITAAAQIWIVVWNYNYPTTGSYAQVFEYGTLKYELNSPTANLARWRITFSGTEIRIYRNWTGVAGDLVFSSIKDLTFPYVALAQVENQASVENMMLTTNPFPKTIYSRTQQLEDFAVGTPPASVQLDIWQHTRGVGAGRKTRVTL
jgi:hypothetical protein